MSGDCHPGPSNARNLFAKGFVTAVDVKKGELDVLTCENDLKKSQTDEKVLVEYTKAKDLATKRSAVAQGQSAVERTKSTSVTRACVLLRARMHT